MHVHLVQPGETLAGIAERYRVTPGQLSLCNDLPPSPFLLPGQALCIPSELEAAGTDGFSTYLVQAGDTLRSLAETWQVPVTWLAFSNNLHDQTLQPGEILLLPHTKASVPEKPVLRMLDLASPQEITLPMPGARFQASMPRTQQVRVDAAGQVHFPARSPATDATDSTGALSSDRLLICSLDGAENILPDVARAILRSDLAQHRIFDSLAAGLRNHGGSGVIFAWHPLRPESESAYLAFVQEAGRRLRPMGLQVGLHLTAESALLKHRRALKDVAEKIDHFFLDPVPKQESSIHKPPYPLFGVEATRTTLQTLADRIPHTKTWLIVHPVAVVRKQEQVLHELSVEQAMQIAYAQGAPLVREKDSGLVWFRFTAEHGPCSLWLEDLLSFVQKIDLLRELDLQGFALWDATLDFPAAWQYVHQHFSVESRKKGSVP